MKEMRDRVRHARRAAGLSQEGLATAVKVHRSAVAQWESHHGTTPSVRHLSEVAVATGVTFEWLATGRGPRTVSGDDWVSALRLDDYALDDTERRALDVLRKLAPERRETLVELLELMSAR